MNQTTSFMNFSYVTVGRLVAVILQAAFYLIFAAILEPEKYGELNYLIAIAGTAALISRFGLNFTVTVYHAKDKTKISDQINTLALISISITSVILLFINIYAAFLSFAISFFLMYQGNLLGLKKYKKFMYNAFLRSISIIIFPIILYFFFDISGIILGMAIGSIIGGLPFFKKIKLTSFFQLKNYYKVLIHNFGVNASTELSLTVDKLLIVPLFGFFIVGIYQLNVQILIGLSVLPTILYSFLLSEESSGNSHKKITLLAIVISIVMAILAYTISPIFINEFFPKYSEGIFSLQIIVLSIVPLTISSYFNAKLQALESTKIGFSAIFRIGMLLLLLALLGQLYGLTGLSWAILLSIIANTIFLAILYYKSKTPLPNLNQESVLNTKICIFIGSYDFREDTLFQKILESQNIEVIECREKINSVGSFVKGYFKMFFRHRKLKYDVMLIPWRGIISFPLAKLVCRKPIVYWSNLSIYHTLIDDRKKAKPNSIYAKLIHFAEKYVCNHCDMIITESKAQAEFLVNEYNLDQRKFRNSVNSVNEEIFSPIPFKKQGDIFQVLFFGGFVPAHGIETIVDAAKILSKKEDIIFNFCGDGPMKKQIEKMVKDNNLKNVKFFGFLNYDKLLPIIEESDVCLGIFGTSEKAANVIPNKILQILSSQKPLITMDSKGVKEIYLKNEENCILIPSGNAEKLANSILLLKNNIELHKKIALNGYKLYIENLSNKVIGKKLVTYLNEVQKLKN